MQDGNSDTTMSQPEMYSLSDSAAAALALTELSAASEDRKSPVKPPPIIKESTSPYERQSEHVNPYQIGGRPSLLGFTHEKESEYKPHITHAPSPSRFYPKESPEHTRLPSISGYTGSSSTAPLQSTSPTMNHSNNPSMDGGKSIPSHKRKVSRK